jgi:arabinogalactan oligomer / maltooligosaccharide transport system permease protein
MIKKLLLIFSLLLLILFAGCGAPRDENEIVIWHQMRVDEREILERQIKEYENLNPGVRVTQLYKETEELRSGYIVASIGGQGPDLIYGPSDQVGPFETMGIIKPLDELFDSTYLSNFNENGLVYSHGKLWMIADKIGNHLTLVYNKDLVPEPPNTDKEFISIAQSLTKDFNGDGRIDQYGVVWNYTEPFFFIHFLTGYGGWFFKDDTSATPNLNTPAMVSALKFIQDLRDKYKVMPAEADYEIADVLFKEGRAAMMINGDWSWASYGKAGLNYGIHPLPFMTETGLYASPLTSPKGYSVNSNITDEKLAKVKPLLEFLLSPEKQLEVATVIKTFPTRTELYDLPEIQDDPILVNSKRQIELGTPMPIITEMRAIWDAVRPIYQGVLGGNITPERGAERMQQTAVQKIKEMREDVGDPTMEVIIQLVLLFAVFLILYLMRKSIKDFFINLRKNSFAYILALPALIIMLAVIFYPFVYNLLISLSNMNLNHIHDWSIVGFQQYIQVFKEPQFYEIFLKTIIWTATNIFFHVVIGVTLALLLNRNLPGKGIFRTLLILPWAIPQYITALTWRGMFNYEYGSVNLILVKFMNMSPVEWLKSPVEAFAAIIITNIWLGFPFMMIIALGALQSIPAELYEAADLDGAKWYQKLKSITIPLIKPVMVPAITLGVIWTFNNLNVVWLVSNAGEPSDQTHILVSYVYKAAFNLYRYGYAAAFSVIIFIILALFGLKFLQRTKAAESVY